MGSTPVVSRYADIEAVLSDLCGNEENLHAVTDGLSDSELSWQPNNGADWSILQCAEHLSLSNRAYTTAMSKVVNDQTKLKPRTEPIRPSALGAIFLKKLEPPVKSKVRAPRLIVPTGNKSKNEIFEDFHHSHDQIRGVISSAGSYDLNALRFRNPLLRVLRVRVGTGLLIMAAHERRHLWQAWRVRAELAK